MSYPHLQWPVPIGWKQAGVAMRNQIEGRTRAREDSPSWNSAVVVLGLWTVFGVFMSVHGYAVRAQIGKPITWGRAFALDMSYSTLWALLTPVILYLAHRFPLDRGRLARSLPVHVAATLVLSCFQRVAWEVLTYYWLGNWSQQFTAQMLWKSVVYALDYGFLFYWIVLIAAHAATYYHRDQEAQQRASQLETQLAQSQLQALRAQLHPHFLFNTLHTISALVQEDPEAAERMVARLSEFLRLSLENSGAHEVPLKRELEFLERYLEIERIRFEDRLLVEFDIDPGTLEAGVPNLILQPLVENAIRHGIGRSAKPGRVSIRSRRENGHLLMQVADNGWGLPGGGAIREGVGLANTRARLRGMYGADHSFDLRNSPEGGLEAAITIPFKETAKR